MISKTSLFLFIFLTISQLSFAQQTFGTDKNIQRIAFYNVENLFDTVDDPNGRDEEFLPTAKKEWTMERYEKKLNQLAQVFEEMDFPTVIGLCEIENEGVMKDLAANTVMKKAGYETVHFESPDYRGIDVGLMYKKKCFEVLEKSVIRIDFPKEIVENYTTRDVLIVKGLLHGKDEVYFFVNHWPSRRGGLAASSPKREYVAAQVRKKVEEIYSKNANANIILMGDFNDEPDNKSINEVLIKGDILDNAMTEMDEKEEGTYNYRGNWNMIDQFIVSKNIDSKNNKMYILSANVLREDYLYYTDKKYGKTPTRTYGGSRYFGGYSDHLPIYIDLYQKSKKERK
ncbi:MAG: putative extracellular nuclease [Saprospiraceae bacterium]|jgi:predicted extracellular nuclease